MRTVCMITMIALLLSRAYAEDDLQTCTAHISDLPLRRRRELMQTRQKISLLKRVLRCKMKQYREITILADRLRSIRKCLYNGLPYSRYAELREVCQMRSEQLMELRQQRQRCNRRKNKEQCYRRKVAPLRRQRADILKACQDIGWDGDRNCEELEPVKSQMRAVKQKDCGVDKTVSDIRAEIDAFEKRVENILKLSSPVSSNAPREY